MADFLTGIRPTNTLHIGNYFGAIKPLLDRQREHDGVVMIVDYHAMDTETNPDALRKNILALAATYLAAGVDTQRSILFQQSRVPEHTELAWIFSTLMRLGELERMTQFKDKSRVRGESVPVALMTYPLLMAADILLYSPATVPVGEDQKQHVELARDIAERFNKTYGDTFVVPKVHITQTAARVMALDDPAHKMSKSAASDKGYISLLDEPSVVQKKIGAAVTDTLGAVRYSDEQPGIKNLVEIYSVCTDILPADVEKKYAGVGYGTFKQDVAQAVIDVLVPLQHKIKEFLADEHHLKDVLDQGARRAKAIAEIKMQTVRDRIGVGL